jgi:hypothetical protein
MKLKHYQAQERMERTLQDCARVEGMTKQGLRSIFERELLEVNLPESYSPEEALLRAGGGSVGVFSLHETDTRVEIRHASGKVMMSRAK